MSRLTLCSRALGLCRDGSLYRPSYLFHLYDPKIAWKLSQVSPPLECLSGSLNPAVGRQGDSRGSSGNTKTLLRCGMNPLSGRSLSPPLYPNWFFSNPVLGLGTENVKRVGYFIARMCLSRVNQQWHKHDLGKEANGL